MKKILCSGLLLLLLVGCGNTKENKKDDKKDPEPIVEEKKVTIVDTGSNQRTYAVMINNHKAARPQSGLQEAYIVYEFMVEGGITRMMALYRDTSSSKIGSVRSSRHYYLDYVLENDAMYFHWGGSPQAYSDMSSLKITHADAVGSVFWKDKSLNRATEHTAFTSTDKMSTYVTNKKIRDTSTQPLLLTYTVDEIDYSELEDTKSANNISIKYSNYQIVGYEYDSANKVYKRFANNKASTDLVTGKQYTAKNIIVYDVKYNTIKGDTSGRQEMSNIGKGSGYYITNGYATSITWEKTSRSSQTVYKYLNGEEIKVSDGNTFIQIYPTSGNLTIN